MRVSGKALAWAVLLAACAGVGMGLWLTLRFGSYEPSPEFVAEMAAHRALAAARFDTIQAQNAEIDAQDERIEGMLAERARISDALDDARAATRAAVAEADSLDSLYALSEDPVELGEALSGTRTALRTCELEAGICEDGRAQSDSTIADLRESVLSRDRRNAVQEGQLTDYAARIERYQEELGRATRQFGGSGRLRRAAGYARDGLAIVGAACLLVICGRGN